MQLRDLKMQYLKNRCDIDTAIQKTISSADFIGGKEVKELEEQLAEYVGVKHCLTCANGTDAMNLLLMAWGIQKGDAVFVPDFTFFSSAEVVAYNGAVPVFVDVKKDTFNMDTDKLEKAIQKVIKKGEVKPRAIIAVDLFGLPAEHDIIEKIAKKYNLLVLEDGAQGFGGNISGRKACSFGNAAATSFFPAKPLGCYGDGGAVFTNDSSLAKLLESLKMHGKGSNKYDNVRIGINSRLDSIQAAILLVKLKIFKEHELEDVNRIAEYYHKRLKDTVPIPEIPDRYYSSFAQYTVRFGNIEQRDKMQKNLTEKRIPCMVYYPKPLHAQEAFSVTGIDETDFEVSNELCRTVLSLPMHPYLTEEDVDDICSAIISSS